MSNGYDLLKLMSDDDITRLARQFGQLADTFFSHDPVTGLHVGDVLEAIDKERRRRLRERVKPLRHLYRYRTQNHVLRWDLWLTLYMGRKAAQYYQGGGFIKFWPVPMLTWYNELPRSNDWRKYFDVSWSDEWL